MRKHNPAPRTSGTMSAAEFREAHTKTTAKTRKGKYNAVGVRTEEGYFDSKTEHRRWIELRLMERAGEISDLQRQVKYSLDVNGIHITNYIADFVYKIDNIVIVEDSKGFKTPEYKMKKSLMRAVHGIEILETGANCTGRKR